jgi:hypothetical protein
LSAGEENTASAAAARLFQFWFLFLLLLLMPLLLDAADRLGRGGVDVDGGDASGRAHLDGKRGLRDLDLLGIEVTCHLQWLTSLWISIVEERGLDPGRTRCWEDGA